MSCFMVFDGRKTEIDEGFFDQLSEELHQPKEHEVLCSIRDQNIRWKPDGTYDKKPLDPDYFKNYYQGSFKTPIKRPDCGKTITSKSSLPKHRQTNFCKNNRNRLSKVLQEALNHLSFKGFFHPQIFPISMFFVENVHSLRFKQFVDTWYIRT